MTYDEDDDREDRGGDEPKRRRSPEERLARIERVLAIVAKSVRDHSLVTQHEAAALESFCDEVLS